MGKNDGALIIVGLFGAAFIWNKLRSIKEDYLPSAYLPSITGVRGGVFASKTGYPIWEKFEMEAQNPVVIHTPQVTGASPTREQVRHRIYKVQPNSPGQGFVGVSGKRSTTTPGGTASTVTKTRIFKGAVATRRILAPKPRDPGVIPSGATGGYSSYGKEEPLK